MSKIDINLFNSFHDFSKFLEEIDPTGVITRYEFKSTYPDLYERYRLLKNSGIIRERLKLPVLSHYPQEYINANKPKPLIRLNEIQNYIIDNDIKNPTELLKINPGVYERIVKHGLAEIINYKSRKMTTTEIQTYDTLEKIEEFVLKNKIKHRNDFAERFEGLFKQYKRLRKLYNSDISFYLDGTSSDLERDVIKHLYKYSIGFTTQFSFPDFIKNKSPYRYDFWIKGTNILIEAQGPQHFRTLEQNIRDGFITSDDYISADIIKNEYANSQGFKVYYYSTYINEYNKYGCKFKIYFNMEELLLDAGFDLTNIDPDYEIKFNNNQEILREQAKEEIQDYINKNNISYFKDLGNYKKIVIRYKLRSELVYCEDLDKVDLSWIKTVDDINKFLLENKIKSTKDLLNHSKLGSSICKVIYRKSWLKDIQYYREK